MMSKTIIQAKNKLHDLFKTVSFKTRKEFVRFILAFSLAWFFKTLINEFPFFTNILLIPQLDSITQKGLIALTTFILNLLGYSIFSEGIFIQIKGTVGIRYELGCLAFRHLTLFIVFILTYYGKFIHKLWYIPAGILFIFIINAIRGSIICISQLHFPNHSIAIHDIISPILMSPTILFLWLLWVIKFGSYQKG